MCQKATFALQQIFLFDHLVGTAGQARTVLFPKLVDVIEQPAHKFSIPNIAVIFDDGCRRASDQNRAYAKERPNGR
jgi:hypothetical protein